MCSGDTHDANIAAVTALAAQAARQGAELLCLPEVAGLMNRNAEIARQQVVAAAADPFIGACRDLAAKHGLWIHIGSTPVLGPGWSVPEPLRRDRRHRHDPRDL
jgi:predicted amidohydrolase